VLFAVSALLGVFEHLSDWLLAREQRGGVFALLTLLGGGAAVFSALRWRQAAVETRKRIEAERRYRLLVEQAPVVIYALDHTRPTGEVSPAFVSPQIESLLGYSAEEWTADPALRIGRIHPDDREKVVARSDDANRSGGAFHMEYRAIHRDGRIVWIHDEARPVTTREDGTPTLVQGVMVDITRTRAAEEHQRETHRRFQALVERLPAVTYVEDAETGTYRYLSPQIESLTGYPLQRWLDDPDLWAEVLHPDDRERVLAENEADTGDSWSVDYRMLRRDGETVWVHNESVLIRGDDGTPLEWVGVCTDLTAQKEAWDQVRAAEERFRAIVEHIPAAVYLDLPNGSMQSVYVSPQVETVMGVKVERYIDEPDLWLQMMDDEDRRRCERRYLEAVEAEESWKDEYRIRKPDGKLAWIHDETTFITDADGKPLFLLGVLYDVTARKRAEEALRESERREHAAGLVLAQRAIECRHRVRSERDRGVHLTDERRDLVRAERRSVELPLQPQPEPGKPLVHGSQELDDRRIDERRGRSGEGYTGRCGARAPGGRGRGRGPCERRATDQREDHDRQHDPDELGAGWSAAARARRRLRGLLRSRHEPAPATGAARASSRSAARIPPIVRKTMASDERPSRPEMITRSSIAVTSKSSTAPSWRTVSWPASTGPNTRS